MNETCHCGQPIFYHPGLHPDSTPCFRTSCSEMHFTRELCERCDDIRCDAFPGACKGTNYCLGCQESYTGDHYCATVYPTIYDAMVARTGRDPHVAFIEARQIIAKVDSKIGELILGWKANIYNQSRIPLPSEAYQLNGPHRRALKALGQKVSEIS